jgi:transcriptional regulator with XRE-family HTH domain
MTTPTVRKLQLGNELRRMREVAGRASNEAAKALDCAPGKISRLEQGQSAITYGDLKLLLEFYGADEEESARLIELSRDNRRRGRWTGDRATIPEWFRTYFDLERDAEDLRMYQVEIVPGLFQTEAYMRAVYSHRIARSDDGLDVDAAVRSRLERQEVLDQVDPPTVSCVLSESCVRRMVGGREVMAAQLRRLADLADRPRERIQQLPFDSEGVGGMGLRFTLLRIPAARAAQPFTFAYCEDLEDSRYIDDDAAVRIYESAWAGLSAAALGPVETGHRLREYARQLT